jgi:dihydrofolate reductase
MTASQSTREERTMSRPSRPMIAALQMSLDGYIQGANGEVDWVDGWNDALDLLSNVDAAVIGGGTYPGYEQLWGSIAADPHSGTAMLGREPSAGEVAYARWTQRTPHYVLSSALGEVKWETARLVRGVGELRSLKDQPGGAIYVIGGASLVSTLLNQRLIDELRLIVHPIILGGGKAPLAGVNPQTLALVQAQADRSGRVVLIYGRTPAKAQRSDDLEILGS